MPLRVIALMFGLVSVLAGGPLPVGRSRVTIDAGVPIEVFTYKPENHAGGPLIVVFHGVNRNAEEYRDFAVPLAERFGAIVAAPLFDRERFPTEAYQRGGITRDDVPQPRESWTFAIVPRLVAALREGERRREQPYYFIGHSAGGQFLARMTALAGAFGAERVIAANPGSHLFPTRDAPYGYGLGGLPEDMSDDAAIRRYLAAPLTIFLGTGDTDPNHANLDRAPEAMQQGATRYERGRACFEFARKLARERGWEFRWRRVETDGIGHEAAKMFASFEAQDALFGADTSAVE